MKLQSFVAIDMETTGVTPGSDAIIEVGAIRYEEGQEVASLSQLIDPGCAIPVRIQNLTGILPSMLRGKPSMAQFAPALLSLIGNLPLVAHNAPFDIEFLRTELGRHGYGLLNPVFDTLEMSRIVLPSAKSHRLSALAKHFGLKLTQHHRAEDDARACGLLFMALQRLLKKADAGLLRFMLQIGEPTGWELAPVFRAELEEQQASGARGSDIMQWIKPFGGQLHRLEEEQQPASEPSALDTASVLNTLGPDGAVSLAFPAYEHRPQQLAMAQSVAEALSTGQILLMEAGTGTGKSLAYLVPAFSFVQRNGEKVAISTHTINLQEQLWHKDIPFLQEALAGTELEGVRAALVKGRSNYICLRKWEEGATSASFLTAQEERSFHIRLASWLSQTQTGDKSELNLTGDGERLWTDVASESETCLGPRCKWFRNHCFAYRGRRRAADAQILVVNHALIFADIAAGNLILPPFRHLILDEAHHVEDVATNNLGINLENWEIVRSLLHLARTAGQGYLPQLRRRIPAEQRIGGRPPVGLPSDDHIGKLIEIIIKARSAAEDLFRLCAELVESEGNGDEEGARSLRLTPAIRAGTLWESLDIARENATAVLRLVGRGLLALVEAMGDLDPPLEGADGILVELQKQSAILSQSVRAIDAVLLQPTEGDVVWIEASMRRENPRVALRSAPINVGEQLRTKLFERLRSVVMTSATLAVSGGFDHLRHRLGLAEVPPDRLATGLVTSPFRYRNQALLCIPEDMPNPKSVSEREYTRAVEQFLRAYLLRTGGRTLVLFTSHRQLRQVYSNLKSELEEANLLLLGQGLDGGRGRLVEEFREASNAVLFGSASFWEGVDIPGDGLTSVILVRLPFMAPGNPVMEARIEDLESRGVSSFTNLSLPLAVIRFKQGFGRLVRTGTDRGVVIVLDNRLSSRQTRYGSQFIKSLPGPTFYAGPTQSVIDRALDWLNREVDAE